jgi:RNA polymerase sigma factor (sigma-70 family)
MTVSLPMNSAPAEHAPPGFLSWVSAIVHAHRARLLAYARKRGLDAEDSLDAVQDTFASFLKLPEARSIARDSDDALKMLTVILRHHTQNATRKRSRRAVHHAAAEVELAPSGEESSEHLIARAEELGRVHGCILRMARLQREVVMLSLLDEQPREHVAQLLELSEGHVRVLLHRAREHLRHCSFEYDDDRE